MKLDDDNQFFQWKKPTTSLFLARMVRFKAVQTGCNCFD